MAGKGINSVAVGIIATGGLLIWSGLNNAGIIESLKALASGEMPPKHRKEAWQDINADGGFDIGGGNFAPFGTGDGADIVNEANKWIGKSKYVYGGCHGCTPCAPGQGVDCSSFVTWVMQRTGHYKGKCSMVAGSSMLAWGKKVPWSARQPGDVALWPGKHCAIITGPNTTVEAQCTACGPVKTGTYGTSHAGISTVILRAPDILARQASQSDKAIQEKGTITGMSGR